MVKLDWRQLYQQMALSTVVSDAFQSRPEWRELEAQEELAQLAVTAEVSGQYRQRVLKHVVSRSKAATVKHPATSRCRWTMACSATIIVSPSRCPTSSGDHTAGAALLLSSFPSKKRAAHVQVTALQKSRETELSERLIELYVGGISSGAYDSPEWAHSTFDLHTGTSLRCG